MDNIQLILYIVFLVGYFLFKLLTGKKKPATREDTRKFDQQPERDSPEYTSEYEQYDPEESSRPKSFEEILEELAGGGKRKEVARETQEVKKNIQRKEEKLGEDFPQVGKNFEASGNEVYQKSINDAKKYSTLDERIDLENLDINRKEVVEIEELEEQKSNPYLDMFSNLEDAKKAIVMTEILNRKY